ncbi:stressosome-associated protein Prli42 [Paenibacillus amylolyticus]
MQKKKWFKIVIYLMLAAMIGSTLFIALEPLLFG